MSGMVTGAPHNNSMVDIFAHRFKVATRAIGMTDVLSPSQVRTFSDCEVRWFYEHLLGLPDPPTANLALDKAVRAAILINFRHKRDSKEDIETEGVVGLFRREWKRQQTSAIFCDDEVPEAIGSAQARDWSANIWSAWPRISGRLRFHQLLHGVISAVRIRTELDLIDVEGTIIDIRTSPSARLEEMHRFELATCARLAPGASGVVRSDILVARNTLQHLEATWEVTEADIRWSDALYPVAQHAMQRGYYMPNRNSRHCSRHEFCPITGAAAKQRILVAWWKLEAIYAACRGKKSASLLTACIVFGVAPWEAIVGLESDCRSPGRRTSIAVILLKPAQSFPPRRGTSGK